jgi:hypothetical protein
LPIIAGVRGVVSVDARPNALLPLPLRFRDDNGALRTLGDALGQRPGPRFNIGCADPKRLIRAALALMRVPLRLVLRRPFANL